MEWSKQEVQILSPRPPPDLLPYTRDPPGIVGVGRRTLELPEQTTRINIDVDSDNLGDVWGVGGWEIKSWQCSAASSLTSL